ncbi:uroporphyrinogen-III C-methyltransferase [Gloeobacter violaceus]|uniref:uroporphyrinogen-III C-methyltransferase n=1 Tax=Gloeobacter violaceus (strain ATCC 29082 / PCC 7421) TaxID=251221 RepID=Q7NL92_GLOVI|nr:uroporphyrinogen-III C-methyltransferase [Gloeobacter violaceus]BAC89175.1 uroporphyrinogen III synthase/methyltransferase [Gloeobacter violaceus PCC 7421]
MPGTVYLVGAGPAGAEYLTVRGRELLEQAEVVLYDDLADPHLLKLASAAQLIDVGKRAGRPGADQGEIGRLLVTHCQAGRRVVRLKAGDPLVFGRAAAELGALVAAGCNFEIVPGVSSALAACAFAGIPLTDRALGRHFCVMSGHDIGTLPWQHLAHIDTLVILMGTRHLEAIAEQLMDYGRPAAMPVAVIFWAGRSEQRTVVGTLEDIASRVAPSGEPAVIVVGPVVRRRECFDWFDRRALFGKHILVTRAADQAGGFSAQLEALGASVLEMPALVVTAPTSWEPLDRAIAQLAGYRWLLLTSANGVEAFFARLTHHRRDLRALGGVRVAAVGPKTAQAARTHGLICDFVPGQYVSDGLLTDFPDIAGIYGERVLFVRVESGGRETITEQFRRWGALVDEVAGYATGCPDSAEPGCVAALRAGRIDCATFASAKTVRHFARLLQGEELESLLRKVRIASIGPQTSAACRETLGRVDVEAEVFTLDGLAQAIVADLGTGRATGPTDEQ